jgi:hypothetical protein
MKRSFAAPILLLVGACLFFLTGWAFTLYGGLLLTAAGLGECSLAAVQVWRRAAQAEGKGFRAALALQETGYILTASGLGCVLLQYQNAALPFICFSAAALFLADLVLSLVGLILATSKGGNRLALLCVADVPLTLGFAALWQLTQGALSLPMAEAASWSKAVLAVIFATLGLTYGLRLGACGLYYHAACRAAKTGAVEGPFSLDSKASFHLAEAVAPLFLFLLGLFPFLLVSQAERLLLSVRLPFPVGDYIGLIWGGAGRYAIYSPIILAVLFFTLLAIVDGISGRRPSERREDA